MSFKNIRPAAPVAPWLGSKKMLASTEIETGRKQGSVDTLRALAVALDVTLDDLAK